MNFMGIGLSVAVFVASVFLQSLSVDASGPAQGFDEDRDNIQLAQFRGEGRNGGKKGFCDQYAQTAVDQSGQNDRRGCGYTGDRWHPGYESHFDWCMKVGREAAGSEANARADELARCGSGGRGNREFCKSYARSAVKQNERNERRRCGYTGERWHSDYQEHFRWCLDVRRGKAESETNSRDEELKECRRGY